MQEVTTFEDLFPTLFWQRMQQDAPVVIGMLALIWLLGYISRWLIHRQPEFGLKSAMLRGTWQVPVGLTGLVAFVLVVQLIGVEYTDYPLSFTAGSFFSMSLLAFAGSWLLPDGACFGYFAVFSVASARLKSEEIDWGKTFAEAQRRRQSRGWRIMIVLLGIVLFGTPVYILSRTVPMDQFFAAVRRTERLGEAVRQQLDNPLVEQVVVGGPPIVDERKIFVILDQHATDQQMTETHEHARNIIRQLDPQHTWDVIITAKDDDTRRLYPPQNSPANQPDAPQVD